MGKTFRFDDDEYEMDSREARKQIRRSIKAARRESQNRRGDHRGERYEELESVDD